MTLIVGATPGPWRVKSERVIVAQVAYSDDCGRERFYDKEIAWLQPIGSTVQGSREANAHLIAAAPELLTQLEYAVKLLGAFPTLNGTAQVQSMRDTIAIARGGAS